MVLGIKREINTLLQGTNKYRAAPRKFTLNNFYREENNKQLFYRRLCLFNHQNEVPPMAANTAMKKNVEK